MRHLKRFISYALAGALAFTGVSGSSVKTARAADLEIRENVEKTASSDTLIVGIQGLDCTSDMKELLDEVNQVRYEACTAGNVPDPRNPGRMLTPSDYVPIKIGVNCTKAAVIRACEASVTLGHVRPNGTSCSNVIYSFIRGGMGENLAWDNGYSTKIQGWVDEKEAWIRQSTTEQTGHYTSLINPSYLYTGMASFNPYYDNVKYGSFKPNWTCTAGQYTYSDTEVTEYAAAKSQGVIQKVEIPISRVESLQISGDSLLEVGGTADLTAYAVITATGLVSGSISDCPVYDGASFQSSDPSVVSVDPATGACTAKALGSATVTASIGSGSSLMSVEREMVVVPENTTITSIEKPDTIVVETQNAPVLGKTVKAVLSNGKKIDVNVEWESYDSSKLLSHFKSVEFDIAGKAAGFDVVQTVHVNAAKIEKVYISPDTFTVDCGTLPTLPDKVKINLSNNYTWTYNTIWDSAYKDYANTRKGGTFEITGKASPAITTDEGTKNLTFTGTLIVNPMPIASVSVDTAEIKTVQGTAPKLPKAKVTWEDKVTTEEDIAWTENEAYLSGYNQPVGSSYTVRGSYEGKSYSVKVSIVSCLHTHMKKTAAKAATETAAGNTEYYCCSDCGKYFSDASATKEIVKDSWVIKPLGYTPAKKGTKLTDKSTGATYKVTSSSVKAPTVEFLKPSAKATAVSIPASVKINGVNYKVTSVAAGAFKENKKVTKITVGKYVAKIGNKAFYGCTKLKTITVKTEKLKAKLVAAKAFSGVGKTVTIKVPKAKKKTYTSLFRKRGLAKTVRIS